MVSVNVPNIVWSDWVLWSDRGSIPNSRFPGIYRLAVGSRASLPEKGGWARVRYVGVTLRPATLEPLKLTGLDARWRQLDRALQGKGGHSGGDKMFRDYGPLDGNTFAGKKAQNKLFVSAMPYKPSSEFWTLPVDNPKRLRENGIILYLEYEALAQYSEALPRNRRPKFNSK